ncbi:exopolysaccharide biosynthesis protein exod (plasmid) [Sulfitobacter alexandrii]|uniref:Exopolysaccharide biosynthesis protein exod n=1 Tax=Sulfitobacter alexandrii TaxID=1917485 RepID=A0A1J0WMY8_9RHOB|nr:exopolysaccharide biosynthesis protein [Sulfitobacter alexandrii]APE45611.1 exopolysaccharide biosynthesis protein exod [Sulfitobacter alexandrii]
MTTHRALSDVLDRLEQSLDGKKVRVRHLVDRLGRASFASVMLVFSLISTSPASAIPGVTAVVAMITLLLIVQMMIGRESLWLPDIIMNKKLDTKTVAKGIAWLRKPVHRVERLLRPRLTFLFHRPWLWLPMILIAGLTLFMPFMELVPTSGSIASAVIALFAASLLTRDGLLTLFSFALLSAVPVVIYLI